MYYQNELFQSITPPKNQKNSNIKQLFIAFTCLCFITTIGIFFSTQRHPAETKDIAHTIPAITTAIEYSEKKNSLDIDDLATEQPVFTSVPTHSMQSLTTTWQEYKIKPGESLSAIFDVNNLTKLDFYKIIHANDISSDFAAIRAGNTLLIGRNRSGNLSHLIYRKNLYEEIKATRTDSGLFKVELHTREVDHRIKDASGIIHSSLFIDGKEAGLSDNIIMQLANIFAWDIDIAMNLREGDKFSVIYENLYIDNTLIGPGNILAAEFISRGKPIKAIRYENKEGKASYYSPKGNNMRKAFLRTPIDFARISSHFNLKRKHPVLNRIRAHKGVDYAASTGTPIKAAGDGKISFRGRKNGYGNVVILQHGQKYSTLYAHMSKFKKGQRTGSRVKQGDLIGYVGRTGLASGPHLHYEFRINGVHRNPLTVALPNASPIKIEYKADFLEASRPLLKRLDQLMPMTLASSNLTE